MNEISLPQREAPEATLKVVTEFIKRVLENEMAGKNPAMTKSRPK